MQNHTFDLPALQCLVQNAGFNILDSGSYFVKPFTHRQMQELIDAGLLTDKIIDGLMAMTKYMPNLGAEIYVNAKIFESNTGLMS